LDDLQGRAVFFPLPHRRAIPDDVDVDWAGATIPVYAATTGQAWPASLFVSVLGASSYTYAEATRDQQMEAWIQAHIHALEFYGGAPTLAVPDNTKTAVLRA
jgi:transposase